MIFTWHLWGEQNKHFKENVARPAEVVAREFFTYLDVFFNPSIFKEPHKSRLKGLEVEKWLKTSMLVFGQ